VGLLTKLFDWLAPPPPRDPAVDERLQRIYHEVTAAREEVRTDQARTAERLARIQALAQVRRQGDTDARHQSHDAV
jgi:hypothetical protein